MRALYWPFYLQALCMFVDEFYFHRKRGLPNWERFGHPLDTITVLLAFGFLMWGQVSVEVYIALSAFSCLFITKDEFIHTRNCSATENWLHSLMFLLHPLSLLSAWYLFTEQNFFGLSVIFTFIFLFFVYQLLRWSFPWRPLHQ